MLQAERDRLIEGNRKLVEVHARRIRNLYATAMDLEELKAYGAEGLVDAARRWDPARGVAFSTYAYYRIRGAIFDGMREQGYFRHKDLLRFAAGANAYLQDRCDEEPGAAAAPRRLADLADTLGDLATIFVASMHSQSPGELAPGAPHAGQDPSDSLARLCQEETRSQVQRALDRLAPREQQLMRLHYYQGLSLAEAGKRLGMGRSWASRMHTRAVRKLGKILKKLE